MRPGGTVGSILAVTVLDADVIATSLKNLALVRRRHTVRCDSTAGLRYRHRLVGAFVVTIESGLVASNGTAYRVQQSIARWS